MQQMSPWDLAAVLREMSINSGDGADAAKLDQAAEYLDCLSRIHAELNGFEWCADDLDAIAGHLRAAGLQIDEPSDDEE